MLIRKSNRKNTEKSKISKFLISLSFSAKNQRTRKKLGKIITWNFLLFKYKKQAGIGVMIVFVLSSAFYLYFNQVKQSLAADTGFLSPTANAAVAGQGDGNGYETTPTNAYADGAPGSAVDTNSGANTNNTCTVVGADMHTWSSYGISIPAGASINGIEVRQDLAVDNISNGPFSCVALSWDGGTTWTTAQSITLTATGETTYTYGGSASLWGRTWAVGDFSNANFRVRITNGDTINTASTKDFSLDWIPVKVYYSAAYTQSAFRWFANTDTTNVGAAMATQDTAATLTSTGQAFRLRTLIHVAGSTLGLNGDNFKLQYVDKGTGTCASPSGGVPAAYTDVDTTTLIAYKNNTPADAANLTDNVGELTHGADTIVPETYEELNNFTNSRTAINAGEDGKWDFALYDNDAFSASTYCFRIVKSDGTALNTYTVYPSITTATKSCSNELIATDSAASVVVYNVRRSALGGTIPSKNLGTIAITSYSAARRASDGLVFILQRGAGAGLNKLYSFNTSTGVSVLIGTVGSSVPDIYRLAFNGSNVLWAMDNNNVLYTLNTSTAVPTTVCNPVTGTNLVTAGGGDFAYSANGT
ncbi:MAG: hypothetical protein NTX82_07635, partial [Candidatus Parcubacteria bacterium]|nr:hypothetical protein [Candidatus Parcubacteria bacterium]